MTWCLIICRSDYAAIQIERFHTTKSPKCWQSCAILSLPAHIWGCSTSVANNDGLLTQSLMNPATLQLFAVASAGKPKRSRGHGSFSLETQIKPLLGKERSWEMSRWVTKPSSGDRLGYLQMELQQSLHGQVVEEFILQDLPERGRGGSARDTRVWLRLWTARETLSGEIYSRSFVLIRCSLFIVLLIRKSCKLNP